MNQTVLEFGYPDSLVKEYEYWVVLTMPSQVTLGSVVIACKENAERLGLVSQGAWSEYKTVVTETEYSLKNIFNFDKINHLALMMKDKRVYFHVIPRYSQARQLFGTEWIDKDWPLKTELESQYQLSNGELVQLSSLIRKGMGEQDVIDKAPKSIVKIAELNLYTDGGSRGNPGPSSSGFVLTDNDGQIVDKGGEYLGITTNNQAEYQAVKLGLESAKKLGARKVHGHMDSLLVVNQMNGIFKIKNRELWPIHQSIKDLIASFDSVTFMHVPREMNKLADEQVNIILDAEIAKNGAT